MNKILLFLIVLAIVVYTRFYIRPNSEFEIIQLGVSQLKPLHLFEKSPIIVNDKIVDPKDLCINIFRYLYIKSNASYIDASMQPLQNCHKYQVFYATEDTNVSIYHPKYSRILSSKKYTDNVGEMQPKYVDINLVKHQIIILPMFWWYTHSKPAYTVCLDDTISLVIGGFLPY